MTWVSGTSAFATTVGSGVAFTVGLFDLSAFVPFALFKVFDGAGELEMGISVSGKLFADCCDARSRPDEEAI